MTDKVISTRATMTIGPLSVDKFMLPDRSYQLSQTQTAETIGLDEINVRRFLDSKSIKGLLGKSYMSIT